MANDTPARRLQQLAMRAAMEAKQARHRAEWASKTDEERHACDLARFMRRVTRDDPNGCWIWLPVQGSGKYGTFTIRDRRWATRTASAHRFSFLLHKGPITQPMIRHTCDNKECVNPHHLIEGTALDNVHDMFSRNRANKARGAATGKAKLNESKVRDIRRRAVKGRTAELAAEFDVLKGTVSKIMCGNCWAYLAWLPEEISNLERYRNGNWREGRAGHDKALDLASHLS